METNLPILKTAPETVADPFELDVVIALVREQFPEIGTTDLGMAIMLERKKLHPGQTVADLVEHVAKYLRQVIDPPKA